MTRPKPYRVGCAVQGCRRTRACDTRPELYWWICSRHWANVPKAMRRVAFRINRQYNKLGFSTRTGRALVRIRDRIVRAASGF